MSTKNFISPPSVFPTGDPATGLTIGQYLIKRLQEYGVQDVFGIPGDYVLSFYAQLEQSSINTYGATREDCAGFAADAYARLNGIGALCVTYCVGGLSVCNSVAGAFAEKSPVVVISGAPGLSERINNPLLHHKVRDFRTQLEVFEKLCIAGTELTDAATAFREIDRVLEAITRFKRPGYIEIPRDMVDIVPTATFYYQPSPLTSDPDAIKEATQEAADMIATSKKPVILAGVEIHRFGLQDKLLKLAEESRIPIAATLLGKSVIQETHPLYVGLYEGAMGRKDVADFVEESDCVILLGTFMTDINLGIFTANLNPARCIYATSEQLRIRHHHYHGVLFGDFLGELTECMDLSAAREVPKLGKNSSVASHQFDDGSPVTIRGLIGRLNQQIGEDTIVIADIGDSLFAATELEIRGRGEFLSPAYYTSMGFSVPAALGAHVARPDSRVVVICGDGAFQMTCMELSTIIRHGFHPIVIVLDNGGYGTERILHAGDWAFNDILPWRYRELTKVWGGGVGYEVSTHGDWDQALTQAWNDRENLSLIHVHLSRDEHSPALSRLAERLSESV